MKIIAAKAPQHHGFFNNKLLGALSHLYAFMPLWLFSQLMNYQFSVKGA